jgi:hypothetical protein
MLYVKEMFLFLYTNFPKHEERVVVGPENSRQHQEKAVGSGPSGHHRFERP